MPLLSFPDRESWLAGRRNGVGASEIAAVLGESSYGDSPYSVYCSKVYGDDPDAELSESAEWGLLLEPVIREVYARKTGRTVEFFRSHTVFVHPVYSWARASLDATQIAHDGPFADYGRGSLQIKTAAAEARRLWREGPPLQYQIQLQWEMFVAGLSWGSLVCVFGGQRFAGPFDFESDPAFLSRVVPAVAAFWARVERRDPPDVDGAEGTADALKRQFPADDGSVHVGDETFRRWADRLDRVKQRIARAEKVERELTNRIRQRMGAAKSATMPGTRDTMTNATQSDGKRVLRRKKGRGR